MTKSQETINELQEATLTSIEKALTSLDAKVEAGFKGIHDRQDKTNGNVARNKEDIILLKAKHEVDKKTIKNQMYIITVLVSSLVGLIVWVSQQGF